MKTKHLLSLKDWSPSWTEDIFQTARRLKRTRRPRTDLAGKTLGLLFAKPSTRTRISFEVAMTELGGAATFMQASEVGLGVREEVRDVARTLSRYLSGIVVRAHAQRIIEELARYSRVPVINGLSDTYHPCQALADLFTIWERKGRLKGISRRQIAVRVHLQGNTAEEERLAAVDHPFVAATDVKELAAAVRFLDPREVDAPGMFAEIQPKRLALGKPAG